MLPTANSGVLMRRLSSLCPHQYENCSALYVDAPVKAYFYCERHSSPVQHLITAIMYKGIIKKSIHRINSVLIKGAFETVETDSAKY